MLVQHICPIFKGQAVQEVDSNDHCLPTAHYEVTGECKASTG